MAAVAMQKQGRLLAPRSRTVVKVQARLATTSKTVKGKAKAGPYICVDCGYLYTEERKLGAFEDLPNSYACPVCGAGKKRFRTFDGPVSRSNDQKTMAKRRDDLREQLEERGESVGEDASFLYVTAGSAALFLGAVYYFTVLAR